MTALHDAELQAVGDGLDAGHSLPARWYADPDTLEREQELIFRCNWQYAGRADQVAEPGSFITTWAGLVPLAVVRGARRRAAGHGERLPASRPPRAGGIRAVLVAAVPLPRLDVRPRRRAAEDPARRGAPGRGARPVARVGGRARPVRLRASVARRAAVRGRDRRPARGDRLVRRGPRPDGVPPARAVDAPGQLEDRHRELPRVLPLPGRAPRAGQGDRRRARRVPARDAPDVLRPEGHAAGPGRAAVDARRRDRPRAVALPLAERDVQRRAGAAEHLDRRVGARRAGPDGRLHRALLRAGRAGGDGRRADRVRQARWARRTGRSSRPSSAGWPQAPCPSAGSCPSRSSSSRTSSGWCSRRCAPDDLKPPARRSAAARWRASRASGGGRSR